MMTRDEFESDVDHCFNGLTRPAYPAEIINAAGALYDEERAKAEREIAELKDKLAQYVLSAHPVLDLPPGMVALVYDAAPRIAELEAALRKARKAVEGYFAYWGADHDDDDCPEDDTCECPHIRAINDALKETSDTERPEKGGGT